MIAESEDELICDLAETYHIYDIRSFTAEYIATLVIGLRDSSRIKLKASGLRVEIDTLLLAHIADNTAINFYAKTKDAKSGKNRPKSLVKTFCSDPNKELKQYENGADFLEEWRRLNGD